MHPSESPLVRAAIARVGEVVEDVEEEGEGGEGGEEEEAEVGDACAGEEDVAGAAVVGPPAGEAHAEAVARASGLGAGEGGGERQHRESRSSQVTGNSL